MKNGSLVEFLKGVEMDWVGGDSGRGVAGRGSIPSPGVGGGAFARRAASGVVGGTYPGNGISFGSCMRSRRGWSTYTLRGCCTAA